MEIEKDRYKKSAGGKDSDWHLRIFNIDIKMRKYLR